MEFNPVTNKVIIGTMNTTQARAFIAFLDDEAHRHSRDQAECFEIMAVAHDRFGHDTESEMLTEAYCIFYTTEVENHQKDIDAILGLIRQVKEMFKL